MSSDAVTAAQAVATNRHALRIAGGIAVPFAIGEVLGWNLPFVASIFALTLLAPRQPPMKAGAAVAAVLTLALVFFLALLLTRLTLPTPIAFVIGFGLAVFAGLYGQQRSSSPFWFFFLVAVALTPLLAAQGKALAAIVAGTFVAAMAFAILATWLMHALFPDPVAAAGATPAAPAVEMSPAEDARRALGGTLIVLPLMLFLLSNESTAMVAIMTVLSVLRTASFAHGKRAVLGILAANLVAGGIAMVAYFTIDHASSVPTFFVILLAIALFFGERIASGGRDAQLYVGAATAMLVLLGLGLTPFNDASTAFATRVTAVALASLYALAMITLLGSLFAARNAPSPTGGAFEPAP